MDYFLHILILIAIYSILVISLDLIAGYTGLLSIAHAAFYGIGAYATALLSLHFQTNFLINMIFGAVGAAALGVIVAFPSLRIHDDYFVIATFGFQMIVYSIFNNWIGLTRGPLGIPGIPVASLFGFNIDNHWKFLILAVLFAGLSYLFVRKLVNSPYGRVLKAIREDEIFAQSLGKNVNSYKIQVFVIGGALASIAGNLYAHYVTFIDPTSFTILESMSSHFDGDHRRRGQLERAGGGSGGFGRPAGGAAVRRTSEQRRGESATDILWKPPSLDDALPAAGTYGRIQSSKALNE